MGNAIKGFDVSAHNAFIDWEKAKSEGFDFCIIRAGYGYGNGPDKKLDTHVKACEDNGIEYGFYWASYAASALDAQKEAQEMLKVTKSYKPRYPYFFDWEDFSYEYAKEYGVTDITWGADFYKAFAEVIKDDDKIVGLYSNWNYIQKVFWGHKETNRKTEPLWLAYWGSESTRPIKNPEFWQVGPQKVDFCPTPIDVNYCYWEGPPIQNGEQAVAGCCANCINCKRKCGIEK